MIPLAILSEPSDLIASIALATIAIVYGLVPGRLVVLAWTRKRREITVLFAIAGLRRGATFFHCDQLAVALLIASAVVASLAAVTAVLSLFKTVSRVRSA